MKVIKHILFISFFIIICSEQIQIYLPDIDTQPLKGSFIPPVKPTFTIENWFSGNYQDSLMKNYEYSLTMHIPFVRLRNQIGYSFFGEIKAEALEEGKNKVLYGSGYIKGYLGKDFIGEDKVIEKVNEIAYVQTELKKRNIDLIILIAPGKSSFIPENLPSKYDLSKITRSNYDAFTEQFEKQNINYIDYRKYFISLKSKSKYPLFTNLGVHWSGYGATVAGDTLIKYMEKIKHINMINHFYITGTKTKFPRQTDDDLGKLMNLMFEFPCDSLYYPNIVFVQDKTKTKPNVLIIGDSFVWSWIGFYSYFPSMFDKNSSFWYYNHTVGYSNSSYPPDDLVSSLNFKEQTLHRDFIIFLYNESALSTLGDNFVEQMYALLKAENSNNNSVKH